MTARAASRRPCARTVDDERRVHPSLEGADVGQVGDPQPVRGWRLELAVDEIVRSVLALIDRVVTLNARPRRAPRQAEVVHQPLHGAASDADALTVELRPHLVGAINRQVLGMHPGDLAFEVLIADRSRRRPPLPVRPVSVRGDLAAVLGQHRADRLDPETCPVEGHYLLDWRSSSAPKKADAAFKISFARRSSRFSRSSSLI